MFDLIPIEQLLGLLKDEPGSGFVTDVLLFLILISSRGIRKEVAALRTQGATHDVRIAKLETTSEHHGNRIAVIETKIQQ
jgi:hypothetical protein